MQPTYLPWAGYFNLMSRVDVFVLLDDVQLNRRSWQVRNRILLEGREKLLTVPTCKAPREAAICDIRIDHSTDWREKHWKTLQVAYRKAPHGVAMLEVLSAAYTGKQVLGLCDFNHELIVLLANCLGIGTQIVRASALNCTGKRTGHLLNLCHATQSDRYLSPFGSQEYLQADGFSEQSTISLEVQLFDPAPYIQYRACGFVSHLSIVDILANLGPTGASSYVRSRH